MIDPKQPRWAVSCGDVRGYWEFHSRAAADQLAGMWRSAGLDVTVRRIAA